MELLYSYKMSHDNGFAPNPYFGVLTLATCMSKMRQNTKIGNWIAGWTSRKTATSTPPGEERLIYLAKVTDKIPIAEYWDRFPMKRPSNADEKSTHGDNIYCPDSSSPNGLRLVESVYRRPTDTVKSAKTSTVVLSYSVMNITSSVRTLRWLYLRTSGRMSLNTKAVTATKPKTRLLSSPLSRLIRHFVKPSKTIMK